MIESLDLEVKQRMETLASRVDPSERPRKEPQPRKTPRRTESMDLRRELYRAFAVDLTNFPASIPSRHRLC